MSTELPLRIQSHKDGLVPGFAARYRCSKLVYYESAPDRDTAYIREKQIKGLTRVKKLILIENRNPHWRDLFDDLINECA